MNHTMTRTFEPDDILYWQEQSDRKTFEIVTGLVKTALSTAQGDAVTLWFYGPGAVLGLPYETCEITAIQQTVVREVVLTPMQMRRITEQRLRAVEQRFVDLSTKTVIGRLAEMLVEIGRQIGSREIPGTQEEIAQIVGTTHFSVNRAFRLWSQLNIVHIERRRGIVILDPDRLLNGRWVLDGARALELADAVA